MSDSGHSEPSEAPGGRRPLDEREERLWERMDHGSAPGAPLALASTLTPFPAWVMIAGLIVLPVGMALSFFVRRQAVVAFSGEIAVYELSFWRLRRVGDIVRFSPGERRVSLRGLRLRIDGTTYHLEPGWGSNAARIVEIAGEAKSS